MKTFEWGLLKICCALLCIVTLLTACSNGMLDENTSNRVGEEYVEIEGEKTPNGSQEHVIYIDFNTHVGITTSIIRGYDICLERIIFAIQLKLGPSLLPWL